MILSKKALLLGLLISLGIWSKSQEMEFTAQRITIGADIISVSSLNDSAHIAGVSRSGGSDQFFIYNNKNVKSIPFLSGYDRVSGISINNKGQAGGSFSSSDSETDPWVKGFFYSDGSLTGIGTLGGTHTQITGINGSGALSGYSGVADPFPYHAVLYENGALTDLGTIAHDFSRGFDINELNEVVGWSNVVSGENNIYHAFIYRNNAMEDIGTLPGEQLSVAVAVNDSSFVVGTSGSRAFVWYGSGDVIALPVIPGATYSDARDINNNNIIIGGSGSNPVVWIDDTVHNINDLLDPASGITVNEVTAINNNNQLVCRSFNNDGTSDWYILSPKNADFIVNTTGDESDFDLSDEVADVDPDTPGDQTTLRAAIEQANHNPGKNKIGFNISGTNEPQIQIESPLPAITGEVEIDGTTQIGSKVEITGSGAGDGTNGFVIQTDNCMIKGLIINRFGGSGIDIHGNYNEVYDNVIGVGRHNSAQAGNGHDGVFIQGHHNTVGGSSGSDFNIIGGNLGSGILITGTNAYENLIISNYIGTDTLGSEDLGNGKAGIEIVDAGPGNQIGIGLEKSARLKSATGVSISIGKGNIITKCLNAILVVNTPETEIAGNILGLFKTPNSDIYKPMGSLLEGIMIKNSKSATISDIVAGAMGSHGIRITGPESKFNKIFDVIIGTDPWGSEGMGCEGSGICIDSLASENTLGGCDSLLRIVANQQYALQVIQSTLNKIQGVQTGIIRNLRSESKTKSANVSINLGNALGGFRFLDAANNIIGDSCAQNMIASNLGPGMIFEGESILNIIKANLIGTDELGTEDLGNQGDGMIFMEGANNNMIGGNNPGDANISVSNEGNGFAFFNTVSNQMINNMSGLFGQTNGLLKNLGNKNSGALVKNSREMVIHLGFFGGNKHGIRISGENSVFNKITGIISGTDSLASQNLGNINFGILLDSLASNNILGGLGKDSSIVVGGNNLAGLKLLNTKRNQMFNMLSGIMQKTHESSMTIIKNLGDGVVIENSEENQFGDPAMPNIVSGNGGVGIFIKGSGSSLNKIIASIVGTSGTGSTGLGNFLDGIKISEGAIKNIIGGLIPGEEVISAGNGGSGFAITGRTTAENSILGSMSGIFKQSGSSSVSLANKIGFYIENAQRTQILKSIFAANLTDGGLITGAGAQQNEVSECWFGTDSVRTPNLGNLNGMRIINGAKLNLLGGGGRNYFAGNREWGLIINNADQNQVMNNIVGIIDGLQNPLKNLIGGIKVENSIGNSIGRSSGGMFGIPANIGNLVQGHDSAGVAVINSPGTNLVGNEIIQNKVGMMVKMDSTLQSILQRMIIIQNKLIQNLRAFEGTNTEVYLAGNSIVDNTGIATGIHLFNSSGKIAANQITNDAGDGIALEDGSNPLISKNNIYNNSGFGVRNLDESVMVNASKNWWGDAGGPAGNGPGSGDEVSGGVSFENWKSSMISLTSFAARDTVFILPGQSDTIDIFTAYFQEDLATVSVTFNEDKNWLTGETGGEYELSGDVNGAVSPLILSVPANTPANETNRVVIHSETSEISVNDTFYLTAYSPMLVQLSVSPDTAFVQTGSTLLFTATGFDQEFNTFDFNPDWKATGGTIDGTGLYTAGTAPGNYYVAANDPEAQLSDTAVVVVSLSTNSGIAKNNKFFLHQNFPNPLTGKTTIEYGLAADCKVSVRIFSIRGELIADLVQSVQPAGFHTVDWNSSGLPGGIYIYTIEADEINGNSSFRDVRKLSVLKR